MTSGWIQIAIFFLFVLAITKPLGVYMARVFSRERTFFDVVARPVERLIYRLTGVNEEREMRWTEYALSMLAAVRHSGRASRKCSGVEPGPRCQASDGQKNS